MSNEIDEIIISPFDNDFSILYKWSRYLNIPSKLIYVSTYLKDGKDINKYSNVSQIIQNLVKDKKNLKDIINEMSKSSNKINPDDIIIVYSLVKMNATNTKEIIDEINQYYYVNFADDQKVANLEELQFMVNDWRNGIADDLESDLINLENLEIVHEELNKYPEVLSTEIIVDTVTLKASTYFKNTTTTPTHENGITMFDQSQVSNNVPYIRYKTSNNENSEDLFKLYKGKIKEEMPNYKIAMPVNTPNVKDNAFFFSIWNGKDDLKKATAESYIKGYYNLDSNTVNIKRSIEDISNDDLVEKLEASLPITVYGINETKISGNFFLYDLEINDLLLFDMILNNDLMNSYLFFKENTTSHADKKQIKIYYKSYTGEDEDETLSEGYIANPSSVSLSLVQKYSHGGEIVSVNTSTGIKKYKLPANLPYVKAKITQGESKEIAIQFLKIFSRLMNFYKQEVLSLEQEFLKYIPEFKTLDKKQDKKKSKRYGSKIEMLKEAAPEVFVNGYARKCQINQQPIIIQPNEIDAWRNKTFNYKGITRQRQIMSYPPDKLKWNFVCPDDKSPFPGVKKTDDLSNRDIYPSVPCCYKDDQMSLDSKSTYNEWYRGQIKKDTGPKEKLKIKTDKILPGTGDQYGFLPKSIYSLLSGFIVKNEKNEKNEKNTENDEDLVRMGVPRSVNSMLHSISIAVSDPEYLKLKNMAEKEAYVINMRRVIAEQSFGNLMKQELYDFTEDEILEKLNEYNEFLDPRLFYRAIEEAYNLNIYVFSPNDKITKEPTIDVPRFKLFHSIAPKYEKYSVLLYLTQGSESDALEFPQCELIIKRNKRLNKNTSLFPPKINNLLHDVLSSFNKTITWGLNKETETEDQITTITARSNIYSRLNYYYLLNKLPNEQIIDGYGKTRAFNLNLNEKEKITVIVPSTQPENLPSGKIYRSDINPVVGIFGDPTYVTKNLDKNYVNGLWYSILDLEYGIYIPIKKTVMYLDVPEGPENPLIEQGLNVVERIRKIKKDLETIKQIIVWLFLISKKPLIEFINSYTIIGNTKVENSSAVYDFSKLKRTLPKISTVEEGINYIKKIAPSFIKSDRLFLYSKIFFDGILYYMKEYNKNRYTNYVKIPLNLYYTDVTEEDFTKQKNTAIFTNEHEMKSWVNYIQTHTYENLIINDKLSKSDAFKTEPYLYKSPTGNIFLIQNVVEGNLSRAINVAFNWYLHKINLGHKSDKFPEENDTFPVNVVYGISSGLAPAIIENNAGESESYLQILAYEQNQYSAMLPLL